jgi:membrane protein YqaA with SNARE-associated domain
VSSYLLLFATALGAATILPFYSEVLLISQIRNGLDPLGLWIAATAGNTLGAVVNWLIARYFIRYADRPWFPIREKSLQRSQGWFRKYGSWTLLLSWMPIGGDALTFVAGMMRVPIWVFLPLVALGKGLRYAVVVYASMPG